MTMMMMAMMTTICGEYYGFTPCSPLCSDWIVPLIKPIIMSKPKATNDDLCHILCVYSRKYALMRGVLQSVQYKAKFEVFVKPYMNAICLQHFVTSWFYMTTLVKIITTNWADAIKRMQLVVLSDEVICRPEKGFLY